MHEAQTELWVSLFDVRLCERLHGLAVDFSPEDVTARMEW